MIKISLNPIIICFVFALVAFNVLLYGGLQNGIGAIPLLFLLVDAMGLSYFLGYLTRWMNELDVKDD